MLDRFAFAHRLRTRETLVGTFVKLCEPAVIEILGRAGFDFAVLDAEHGAFGRADIAQMMIASRAAELPVLVRVPEAGGHWIATALDAGAAGVMVPQITDAEMAVNIVRSMCFGLGGRGFSPSTPGADYGSRGIAKHFEQQPLETVLICQVEDPSAVKCAGEIAAVAGVDGLLVGPVDLAVSAGFKDPAEPEVVSMCRQAIEAGAAAGKVAGIFLGTPSAALGWQRDGASLFVLGTDQGFLAQAARQAVAAMPDRP